MRPGFFLFGESLAAGLLVASVTPVSKETKILLKNILESQKSVAKRVRKDFMVSTRIPGVAFLALSLGVLTGFYEATDPIGVPTALLFFLRGDWKGQRSSRPKQQYRVIYCTKGDRRLVKVVEVNSHEYPKKS